jgi:hypothetical protein
MRYFRSAASVYVAVCETLDAAYGYPNDSTKTLRALPLISELPTDLNGKVYLAITEEECSFVLPSEMLPQLLASGAVEEITEQVYRSALTGPLAL